MKKQTVQEKYNERQIMKQSEITAPQQSQQALQSAGQNQLQATFKRISGALQQAHQAVRQAQSGHPLDLQLQQAHQSLTRATVQLEQLKTAVPEIAQGLSVSTQTQLKELDGCIQQASQLLQLIQTQTGSN